MAYKLKAPTTENFSDSRLECCFSMPFLKKLQSLNDEQNLCKEYLEEVINSLEDNKFSLKELRDIKKKILKKSRIDESILLMDCSKQKGKEVYFKKYNQRRKCLLCSKTVLDRCHIVKQSFFRKKKRMDKHYKNFKDHISNTVFLCPTHHSLLDRKHGQKLSTSQMKRVVVRKKYMNSRLIKDIDRELRNIERINKIMDRLDDNIYRAIKKELKVTLLRL